MLPQGPDYFESLGQAFWLRLLLDPFNRKTRLQTNIASGHTFKTDARRGNDVVHTLCPFTQLGRGIMHGHSVASLKFLACTDLCMQDILRTLRYLKQVEQVQQAFQAPCPSSFSSTYVVPRIPT